MQKVRVCRCGSPVIKSEVPGYKYQCKECDEDLYGIETKMCDDWVMLNNHCSRFRVNPDYFIDEENSAAHRRTVGIDKKYSLWKSGASKTGGALLIGTSNKFNDLLKVWFELEEESA